MKRLGDIGTPSRKIGFSLAQKSSADEEPSEGGLGLCRAYGCPFPGTATQELSGRDWYCNWHLGRSSQQHEAITEAMKKHPLIVRAIKDGLHAIGSGRDWNGYGSLKGIRAIWLEQSRYLSHYDLGEPGQVPLVNEYKMWLIQRVMPILNQAVRDLLKAMVTA